MDFKQTAHLYKDELLNNILPFWLEKSQDKELGGYYTCLDREGNVYDTDNSFGCGEERCGCSPCYITILKKSRSGSIALSRELNSLRNTDTTAITTGISRLQGKGSQ